MKLISPTWRKISLRRENVDFCSPHNPAGRVWSRAELERLVGLARKYDVILASDEIHCDFILFENRFTSLGSFFSEYQKIVVFIAPSKTFNLAGLRFSLIIAPDADIRRRIEEKLDRNYAGAANPLSIEAARAAYERGDSWLARQRAHIEENVRFLEAYFRENIPEAIVYRAEGTYLAWVKMAFLNRPAERMTEELIDYGLAVNPDRSTGTLTATLFASTSLARSRGWKKGLGAFAVMSRTLSEADYSLNLLHPAAFCIIIKMTGDCYE